MNFQKNIIKLQNAFQLRATPSHITHHFLRQGDVFFWLVHLVLGNPRGLNLKILDLKTPTSADQAFWILLTQFFSDGSGAHFQEKKTTKRAQKCFVLQFSCLVNGKQVNFPGGGAKKDDYISSSSEPSKVIDPTPGVAKKAPRIYQNPIFFLGLRWGCHIPGKLSASADRKPFGFKVGDRGGVLTPPGKVVGGGGPDPHPSSGQVPKIVKFFFWRFAMESEQKDIFFPHFRAECPFFLMVYFST